jgi:hypothetical protein
MGTQLVKGDHTHERLKGQRSKGKGQILSRLTVAAVLL